METSALLRLRSKNGALQSEGSGTFTSSSYSGLTEIIQAFLGKNTDRIQIACFGVAGPVIGNSYLGPLHNNSLFRTSTGRRNRSLAPAIASTNSP
ncbi:MAG: glucokinase [Gammaproteobacteria bacterium]